MEALLTCEQLDEGSVHASASTRKGTSQEASETHTRAAQCMTETQAGDCADQKPLKCKDRISQRQGDHGKHMAHGGVQGIC